MINFLTSFIIDVCLGYEMGCDVEVRVVYIYIYNYTR